MPLALTSYVRLIHIHSSMAHTHALARGTKHFTITKKLICIHLKDLSSAVAHQSITTLGGMDPQDYTGPKLRFPTCSVFQNVIFPHISYT